MESLSLNNHSPTPDAAPALLENEESRVLAAETRRIMRSGLLTLSVMFGLFLVWAALAPLAEGVPSMGLVVIDTKRKPVQHLLGGRVDRVLVREGEVVPAHAVLMQLDDKAVRATFESARQDFFTFRATENRIVAEQAEAKEIRFDQELLDAAAKDSQVAAVLDGQRQLLASRRRALRAQLDALANKVAAETARVEGFEEARKSFETQSTLINQELTGLRPLVQEGYAARNQLLELEMNLARAQSGLADAVANARSSSESILEARAQMAAVRGEYSKELDTLLAQVRRDARAAEERYRATSAELEATVIRAPVEGQVVGITAQTKGAVVHPGEKIMDIVPGDESLVIEARVPPPLIDRVKPDQITDVRFTNFSRTPTLMVEGRIKTISSDILMDEQTRSSYYLARIVVTEEGMHKLGGHKLQPGMVAEVVFRTGSRTLLNYMLHPLAKRLASAMVEE